MNTTVSLTDAALPKTSAALKNEMNALIQADAELTDEIESKTQTRNQIRWRKAADVFAMSEPSQAGRPAKSGGKSETPPEFKRLSMTAFSKLGIPGFKDRKVIAAYRATWDRAIKAGIATTVDPGDMVDLPDDAFEDYWQSPKTAKADPAQEPTETENASERGSEGQEQASAATPMTVVDRAVDALEAVMKSVDELTPEEREVLREKIQPVLDALILADVEIEMTE